MAFVSRYRLNPNSRPFHIAALASIAVAQPLLDLLGKAPEFLLAHDLGPTEILALAGIVGIALPLGCGLVIALLERAHAAAARVAATAMVSLFAALVALYAMRDLPTGAVVVVSAGVAAGAAAGVLYHKSAAARSFAAWLTPALVVVPLLFLLRPGVQSLVWPREHAVPQSSASKTPVVLIVFDGLPLTALLDANLEIDRAHYPAFAALADESTWYRNATTVSDYTQWAMPAILSGRYPAPRSLPIASDHPETLFTLLGSSHTTEVHEPISRLCPQTLCDHGGEGIVHELTDVAGTLSAAYLHAVLPEALEEELPSVDQGWAEGIPPSDTPGAVWLQAGDRSRRSQALAFVNAMAGDGPEPSLHFLHVLLPHTPLAYLPGGQRYGTERSVPGLLEGRRDRWLIDEWAVTQGYRRFLLQAGYVDTLLGQIVGRLKDIGLYDRALLVVTSDHGGSFKAGRPFRRVTDDTFADVMPIPLLIKKPAQRAPATSDRNVETIDILPTVADLLDIDLPWQVDGISAVGSALPRKEKTIFYNDARQLRTFPPALRDAMRASVDRKVRLFGTEGNPYRIPLSSPHYELIGRQVDDLRVSDVADNLEFTLDLHGDFANVMADSGFLPAHLAGRARWRDSDIPAVVAVATNGTIRATTRTYRFGDSRPLHTWSLLLPPDAFHPGENEVEVFVVRPSSPGPVLHRTHFSHARPVNLLSNAAAYGLHVSYDGLFEREGEGDSSLTWTNGAAAIVVPRQGRKPVRSVRIKLATAGPDEKALLVRANDCDVFEGTVPAAPWSRIFALPPCGDDNADTVIELRSDTHPDPDSGRDLGVAVSRIDLLEEPWPPPPSPLPEADRRSQLRFGNVAKDGDRVGSTSHVTVTVINRGTAVWAAPADLAREDYAVRLGVLWFPEGQTTQPAAVQRVELPRALVPGDSVEFTFQLVPNGADGKRLSPGTYEAWVGLLQEGVDWFYRTGDSVRKLRVVHDARP